MVKFLTAAILLVGAAAYRPHVARSDLAESLYARDLDAYFEDGLYAREADSEYDDFLYARDAFDEEADNLALAVRDLASASDMSFGDTLLHLHRRYDFLQTPVPSNPVSIAQKGIQLAMQGTHPVRPVRPSFPHPIAKPIKSGGKR